MPERPPVFRPVGWQERKPWQPSGRGTKRIRGRQGQKLRAEVLAEEPFCRQCLAMGLHVRAEVVDHIRPLADGGLEARSNRQALCHPCHDAKTAQEAGQSGDNGSSHPDWLRPAACELTIVCGPPMAGKRDYVRDQEPGSRDSVIDLEAVKRSLWGGYRRFGGMELDGLLGRALRVRNSMLAALARPDEARRAWLIVDAPTEAERQWWADTLGGSVVLIDPGQQACEERARQQLAPAALPLIAKWYARSQLAWERK